MQRGQQGGAMSSPIAGRRKRRILSGALSLIVVPVCLVQPVFAGQEADPATPERQLMQEYHEYVTGLLGQMSSGEGFAVKGVEQYEILDQGGHYLMRFDTFVLNWGKVSLDLSPLEFKLTPKGTDSLGVEFFVPLEMPMRKGEELLGTWTLGSQLATGIWDRQTWRNNEFTFEANELRLTAPKATEPLVPIAIDRLELAESFAGQGSGVWSGGFQGAIKGVQINTTQGSGVIDSIALAKQDSGRDYEKIKAFQEKLIQQGNVADGGDLGPLAEVMASLDGLVQLINESTASVAVKNIRFGNQQVSVEIGGFEGKQGMHPDANKGLVYTGGGTLQGLRAIKQGESEGQPPITFSLGKVDLAIDAGSKPLPGDLFAGFGAVLAKGAQMNPGESDSSLDQAALEQLSKMIRLLDSYSSRIDLTELAVSNVLPTPVTLNNLHLEGGFTAGQGEGGGAKLAFAFADLAGLMDGTGMVPRSANLSLSVDRIPPLMDLIPDAATLANTDGEQVNSQIMMQGMQMLLSSALSVSLADTFVAFPATKVSLDALVKVDGAAKFMSTGNLDLTVENPEELKRIVNSLTEDPDARQMLATVTALAERTTSEQAVVVDTVKVKLDQQGQVLINDKDVTPMFFPQTVESEGQAMQ